MNKKIIAMVVSVLLTSPVFAEQSIDAMCNMVAPCLKVKLKNASACFMEPERAQEMQNFLKDSNQSLEHFLEEFHKKEIRDQLKVTCKAHLKKGK